MAQEMISPGVYTNIIDLSSYLTSTSGTIGFVPVITEKGVDNVLTRVTSYQDYITKFGEPDIRTFGKYYGFGPYVATQHLSVSSDLYVIRALPDDATYAHTFIYFGELNNYPTDAYKFDKEFQEEVGVTDDQIEFKYSGTHAALSAFSITPGTIYALMSDIKCKTKVNVEIDVEVPIYNIADGFAESAVSAGVAYNAEKVLTENTDEAVYTTDLDYAGADPVSAGVIITKGSEERTKRVQGYTLDRDNFLDTAVTDGVAFDINGDLVTDKNKDDAYVTSEQNYAVKAKAPKMSNTQMLDAIMNGNDTLIMATVDKLGDLQPSVFNDGGQVVAHNAVLGYVRAVGRGSYYNDLSIKITSDANPANFGTYKFQVFELQDGIDVLCESFNVSFDPTALDADGESLYYVDVINKFSERIVVEGNEGALPVMNSQMVDFYLNDPTLEDVAADQVYIDADGNEQYLVGEFPAIPTFVSTDPAGVELKETYVDNDSLPVGIKLGYKATVIWEAYHAKAWAQKATFDAARVYNAALAMDDNDPWKEDSIADAIEEMNVAQRMTEMAEMLYTWATTRNLMNMNDSDIVTSGEQNYYLQNGSLGSIVNSKGVVNSQIGDQTLCFAYTGLLKNPVVVKNVDESTGMIRYKTQYTDNVYDLDWIYFTIVYDAGYKPDVKQAALDLVDTYRRDCVLISDCGDNADYEDCLKYVGAVKGAADCRIWNTYLAARYEPYSRVYDKFTAKDIWVSPVYHMAKLLPQSDALYGIWYAAAGFTRGVCSDIKELRYSCNKAQRDLFYQAQVNPIVHFPDGMTVWGQLTTQKKNSTLSDLNCVRTVLYIKRALEQYCKNFIFELNDSQTWSQIQEGITPMLDRIVQQRGLRSYSVEVGATDYEIKTKVCHVNVTLEPMKVMEKIQLNMYIK